MALALTLLVAAPTRAGQRRPKLRLVISGAVIAGAFYLVPLALAIRYQEGELAVPVLGPLIDLRRCHECTASPIGKGEVAGLVLDAIFQAGGVALLAAGWARKRPPRVTVAPSLSGLVLNGQF
jgi:hypothetical protein